MSRSGHRVRPDRVAEQIRFEIGMILQNDLTDPRVKNVTCTRVQVSQDLGQARVYVSVLASPEQQKKALEGLDHAAGFVRHLIGDRLSLRISPEIKFVFDPAVEYGIRLEKLIEEARGPASENDDPERSE